MAGVSPIYGEGTGGQLAQADITSKSWRHSIPLSHLKPGSLARIYRLFLTPLTAFEGPIICTVAVRLVHWYSGETEAKRRDEMEPAAE